LPPLDFALSLGAFGGGNPSGTDVAARPWKFVLVWQNQFDFIPDDPSIRLDLRTDITNDASLIKRAALDALKRAYSPWPVDVQVVEGLPNTGDHQALVKTSDPVYCNFTDPNVSPSDTSLVSYECNMEQAQWALDTTINNAQDEAQALQSRDLIEAIGRGIGNISAHEIAHQFLVNCCGMDAYTSLDPNAAGTYNNGDADGGNEPATYTGFGQNGLGIHWETTTLWALHACLSSGWKNFGLLSCAASLGFK
jgi:hypothetical protein